MSKTALLLVPATLFCLESSWHIENSNFLYTAPYTYDYNRLRVTGDVGSGSLRLKLIADNETLIGRDYLASPEYAQIREFEPDLPFATRTDPATRAEAQNRQKLYRLYADYAHEKHRVTAGLMRAAFGVGRIWTPVDFFNPLNSLSIEPNEREGVFGAMYDYALSGLSAVRFVAAQTHDGTTKKAVRLKGYLAFADAALLAYDSPLMQFAGYELEGRIGKSDVGFRSEGGSYTDKTRDTTYAKYILGADYGWENSLTVLIEYLYNGQKADPLARFDAALQQDQNYLGTVIGYQPGPLWVVNLTAIRNLDDQSYFLSPNAAFSLGDETTLTLGMVSFGGEETSELGKLPDRYYLNWYHHF
jgi:hypothetical protein